MRSDAASDLEATDSRTLERRTVDYRSDAASEDPISEPIMDPIKGTDHQPGHDTREPTAALTDEHPEPPMHSLLYERVIPGIVTGSKPTDTDPIDSGGATTPPSVPPVPSPWAEAAAALAQAKDRAKASGELVIITGSRGAKSRYMPDAGDTVQPLPLSPAPATIEPPQPPPSETSVRVVAPRAETLLSLTAAPASKPKRGKGKAADEQIAAIAAQVDRMMGRTGAALPGSGRWKQIVSAVNEAGAARVLARVTAMADAAQGLPSPAAAIFADMAGSKYGTDPILRGHNFWTIKVDDALDASAFGEKRASDKPGDVGRVDSRPSGASAPQASQAVSWPDVLRDLGSDPQHHPDDGPHREAWQRVRQAVLVSIRKPGDPWRVWCDADDRARQNVERLLVGGLVK